VSLSFEERKRKILDELNREDKVQVITLAEELNVSTETIRRDLERLDKERKLKKVYGGAVKASYDSWEPPFDQKIQINAVEKAMIGRLAASLVQDGDTIMVDYGTTTIEMIRHLEGRKNVTIVTHSIPTMLLAMEIFGGRIIFIGGEINVAQQSSIGPIAEGNLQQLRVNKAFISAGGISIIDGVTDYQLNEASISRKMMERAEEIYILADHSKFGKTTFANIAPLNGLYSIITDSGCPEEWRRTLAEKEIELWIADKGETE
jgi:DeoR/GlpR family transcriptional regulator of sugar metabolism